MQISQKDMEEIRRRLRAVQNPVKILFFDGNTPECQLCKEIKELLNVLSQLNPNVSYEVHDYKSELAKRLGIKYAPTITFEAKPNIRFLGIPSGFEFAVLLDDIISISNGSVELELSIAKEIAKVDKKAEVLVFTTPTCPYCPLVVKAFHQFAFVNNNIVANMVDALEYQSLAEKWNVFAVPKTVINEKVQIEGMQPPLLLAKKLREAI